jgi:hypothetical protein
MSEHIKSLHGKSLKEYNTCLIRSVWVRIKRKGRLFSFVPLGPRPRNLEFGKIKNGREKMNGPEVEQTDCSQLVLPCLLELYF